MGKKKKENGRNDSFDVLNAAWVISCNDQNPMISYEGLIDRNLGVSISTLKEIISQKRELFRPYVSSKQLKSWREKMLKLLNEDDELNIPIWLKKIEVNKRIDKVNSLKNEDFFRCQFRINKDADTVPTEIIQWGLNHIESMRVTAHDERERKYKKYSSVWIPFMSVIVGAIIGLSGFAIHLKTQDSQIQLKSYEISFQAKYQNYTQLIKAIYLTADYAYDNDFIRLDQNLERIEICLYNLEPFVSKKLISDVWDNYWAYTNACALIKPGGNELIGSENPMEVFSESFITFRNYINVSFFPALFGQNLELNNDQ